ncbi:MAG: AbrB/MazE/SpoVT family DNA-binding domain-containing protein [Acidobacteria bacterium]|nr:AbrB/MazE/SpoVT family DNA-binding domain-containing protein [Acidobacteriota bacterium]
MNVVTVSSKYQVVIPASVRERLPLRPGQKVRVLYYDGRVELVPVRPMRQMRGFVRGIDTRVTRERDRL